jgi:hypothetical protein
LIFDWCSSIDRDHLIATVDLLYLICNLDDKFS